MQADEEATSRAWVLWQVRLAFAVRIQSAGAFGQQ